MLRGVEEEEASIKRVCHRSANENGKASAWNSTITINGETGLCRNRLMHFDSISIRGPNSSVDLHISLSKAFTCNVAVLCQKRKHLQRWVRMLFCYIRRSCQCAYEFTASSCRSRILLHNVHHVWVANAIYFWLDDVASTVHYFAGSLHPAWWIHSGDR